MILDIYNKRRTLYRNSRKSLLDNVNKRKNNDNYIKISSPFHIVDKCDYLSTNATPNYAVSFNRNNE